MHLPHVSPSPPPKLLPRLPKEHLLRDLIEEHEMLLEMLEELDQLIEDYRDLVGTPEGIEVAARIGTIADDLLHAEPHHQREEKVLFPELEKRGITMPPRVMTREHQDLRACKQRLLLAATAPHPDSEAIAEAAGTLAPMLRDHIYKENEVLYPMAFVAISDVETWERMRVAARSFGPCCNRRGCKGHSA